MTAGRGGAALYTPDLLALAVSLGEYPLDPAAPLSGEAKSRTCGSRVEFACATDGDCRIVAPGVRAHACAVGQAAAAIFVGAAAGRDHSGIEQSRRALAAWLSGSGELPEWPGIEAIEPARAFPGRHGAIVLAWDAALAALSNAQEHR